MDPKARRPYMPGYGVVGPSERTGLLPWEWATARLIRSHDYWLATVRPDGRPHVTPVWGVWRDDTLWFSCSRRSRKARNLEQNPAVVATTDEPRAPVIVEGRATTVDDHAEISTFAVLADTKYQTNYGMEFYADPTNACFRIEVRSVLGLTEDDFTGSPTLWDTSR